MPEQESLTYTVTPGPDVLKKMGQTWTLYTSPPAMFAYGPEGELPSPVTLTLTKEQAAELRGDGYEVEGAPIAPLQPAPDNGDGVEPQPRPLALGELMEEVQGDLMDQAREETAAAEAAPPGGDPGPDAGPGIDPIGPPNGIPGEAAIPPGADSKRRRT
jgi:hypothetical protein